MLCGELHSGGAQESAAITGAYSQQQSPATYSPCHHSLVHSINKVCRVLLRANEHTVVLSLKFFNNIYIHIYSVTVKYKICVITFTENYGESRMRASKCCFHLVLLARPFTRSLPTRIASMVDMKQS